MIRMKHKILIGTLFIALLFVVGCSSQTKNTNLLPNDIINNNGFSNFEPLEYKETSEKFMIENAGKEFFEKYVSVLGKDDECTNNGEIECYKMRGYILSEN